MKYYLSVCRQIVARNRKLPRNKQAPPIRLSRGKYGKSKHLWKMKFPANAIMIYNPQKPMPWGARVWIEWDVK